MEIGFGEPLVRGYQRMQKDLFQPFDLNKWIYVGFTSFLASLTGYSGGSGTSNFGLQYSEFKWDHLLSFPENAKNFLQIHPDWMALIIIGLILLFTFWVIICWVNSRGKFMFLDNVIRNKEEIVQPWHEFKNLGNSLFYWFLGYNLIILIVILLLVVYTYGIATHLKLEIIPPSSATGFLIGFIFTILLLITTFGYISMFLNHFVIQIMYKERIGVLKAWSKFMALFFKHAGWFVVYGLFLLILNIIVITGILIISILTCCIGLILVMLPFVNSVVLLPVNYTFRAFSIEFLEQFRDKDDLNNANEYRD